MGIKGLWKMLEGKKVENTELSNKTMCVDGNFVLFACLGSSDVKFITEYTLDRVGKMLSIGIDPIMIFDGKKPMYKTAKKGIRGMGSADMHSARREEEVEVDVEEWRSIFGDLVGHKKRTGSTADSIGGADASTSASAGDNQRGDSTNQSMDTEYSRMYSTIYGTDDGGGCEVEQEKSMEDFSKLQMGRITRRYKYLQKIKQDRVHGDSKQTYTLEQKRRIEKKKKEKKKRVEYKRTEKEMERLKDLIFEDASWKGEKERSEACNSSEYSNSGSNTVNSNSDGTNNDTAVDSTRSTETIEIAVENGQSEYQRQSEMYRRVGADEYLQAETDTTMVSGLDVSHKIIISVLEVLHIKYALSPAESDAIYANIERAVDTDGVITEDSDILLFSTKPIYRHMFKTSQSITVYGTESTPIRYTWAELLVLSWILGSDYSRGIRSIGPEKAKKVIKEYRKLLSAEATDEQTDNSRNVNIACITKAFDTLYPEVEISKHISTLVMIKRIYTETDYKVKIENMETRKISIPQLSLFMKNKTQWKYEVAMAYISMIEKENKKRDLIIMQKEMFA